MSVESVQAEFVRLIAQTVALEYAGDTIWRKNPQTGDGFVVDNLSVEARRLIREEMRLIAEDKENDEWVSDVYRAARDTIKEE